jgi:hypothetical protein
MNKPREPKGIYFSQNNQDYLFVTDINDSWFGWIVKKHPDGYWVSYKKIDPEKREEIEKAIKINRLMEFLK